MHPAGSGTIVTQPVAALNVADCPVVAIAPTFISGLRGRPVAFVKARVLGVQKPEIPLDRGGSASVPIRKLRRAERA